MEESFSDLRSFLLLGKAFNHLYIISFLQIEIDIRQIIFHVFKQPYSYAILSDNYS